MVVSLLEHHSNLVPWQVLCEEVGAHLRVIEVDDEGRLKLDSLEELLDDRVKLVAVTAVSNVLGTITPREEIKRLV